MSSEKTRLQSVLENTDSSHASEVRHLRLQLQEKEAEVTKHVQEKQQEATLLKLKQNEISELKETIKQTQEQVKDQMNEKELQIIKQKGMMDEKEEELMKQKCLMNEKEEHFSNERERITKEYLDHKNHRSPNCPLKMKNCEKKT